MQGRSASCRAESLKLGKLHPQSLSFRMTKTSCGHAGAAGRAARAPGAGIAASEAQRAGGGAGGGRRRAAAADAARPVGLGLRPVLHGQRLLGRPQGAQLKCCAVASRTLTLSSATLVHLQRSIFTHSALCKRSPCDPCACAACCRCTRSLPPCVSLHLPLFRGNPCTSVACAASPEHR